MQIKIILKGNPYSTNNIYSRNGINGYIKSAPKRLKNSYIMQAKMQYKGPILIEEIDVKINIYFGDKRKRDIDNFHKLSLDALTGIIWEDDSQVKRLFVEKFYCKENPRTELNIDLYKK